MKKYLSLILSALLIVCLFAGCGSSKTDAAMSAAAAPDMENAMSPQDSLSAEAGHSTAALPENRKWVITSQIEAETENLEVLLDGVFAKVAEMDGYVEDQNLSSRSGRSRSAQLVIRIPAEQADAFLEHMKEASNVFSSSKNLEDITLQYSDLETRLAALKVEEERLMELMKQAETMSDLLEIEKRLTDVHYELENATSRLRVYDNRVDYATIHLNIYEVREFTPVEEPGFLERISTGFVSSVRGVAGGFVDFVVFLIVSSPYLVVWAAVILVIILIVRKCTKKKGKKSADQQIPQDFTGYPMPPAKKAAKEKKPEQEEKK